jgi:hypothetical protein
VAFLYVLAWRLFELVVLLGRRERTKELELLMLRRPRPAETSVSRFVIHPDGSADLTAVSTCTCSVDGRTGTVTFSERGTVTSDAIIDVERKSIDASGGLDGLRAKLEITGSTRAPASRTPVATRSAPTMTEQPFRGSSSP